MLPRLEGGERFGRATGGKRGAGEGFNDGYVGAGGGRGVCAEFEIGHAANDARTQQAKQEGEKNLWITRVEST